MLPYGLVKFIINYSKSIKSMLTCISDVVNVVFVPCGFGFAATSLVKLSLYLIVMN